MSTLYVDNLRSNLSTKITVPSGNTLDVSGGTLVPSAGAVMQIITAKDGIATFNSSSWTSVVSTSITPSSASSKIYIHVCCPCYGGGEVEVKGGARIRRDSTTIRELQSVWYRESTGAFKGSSSSMVVLDSPNTTSSVTYDAQVIRRQGSNNLHLDDTNNGEWVITLMEIAG